MAPPDNLLSPWGRLVLGLRRIVSTWLNASPVAWISLVIAVIGQAIIVGYTHADIRGDIDATKYQVGRNRDESLDRIKAVENSLASVYGSLTAIHSIKTDVEVIKVQIQLINATMLRLERQRRGGT